MREYLEALRDTEARKAEASARQVEINLHWVRDYYEKKLQTVDGEVFIEFTLHGLKVMLMEGGKTLPLDFAAGSRLEASNALVKKLKTATA